MKRSLYLLKRAAESVVNALNLNAGAVVVVVVVVVVRMVAAKNENKNKNQKHFFIQTGQTGVAFTIMDLGWEDGNPSHHDRSKRAMFTTSGLATADA